jgi:putative transposase
VPTDDQVGAGGQADQHPARAVTHDRLADRDVGVVLPPVAQQPAEPVRVENPFIAADLVSRVIELAVWLREYLACPRRAPGRPRTARAIRVLVLEMARDNPGWDYRRIHSELTGLGYKIAPSTVWKILKDAGVDPAPRRPGCTWLAFLAGQAKTILACRCRVLAPLGCTVLHRARHPARAPGRHHRPPHR